MMTVMMTMMKTMMTMVMMMFKMRRRWGGKRKGSRLRCVCEKAHKYDDTDIAVDDDIDDDD